MTVERGLHISVNILKKSLNHTLEMGESYVV